ncbi:MAG: hypothetical protein IPO36_18605 [Anaerolineales bacterium]|nr:hypothetical protein [Anaerolineales bacterium]
MTEVCKVTWSLWLRTKPGHQWWFDQVANDQAQEPWLDLIPATTHSEAIYYEVATQDASGGWRWTIHRFLRTVRGDQHPRVRRLERDTYKYIVYFNGAHFMKDLRGRIGDEAFFASAGLVANCGLRGSSQAMISLVFSTYRCRLL